MQEGQIIFPVSQVEFWQQMRVVVAEVVEAKIGASQVQSQPMAILPEKTLLKVTEVCALFGVSKPTLYEWIKTGRLKSFKIRSRRYISRSEIEKVITESGS